MPIRETQRSDLSESSRASPREGLKRQKHLKEPRKLQRLNVFQVFRVIAAGLMRRQSTLWIEALVSLRVRLPEGIRVLAPGQPVELAEEYACKLLARAPGKVQVLVGPRDPASWVPRPHNAASPTVRSNPAEHPAPPIQPGWLVAYRGPDGRLRGGCDDREHGTVETGQHREAGWTFTLTDGTVLPARAIVSVAKVATDGQVVAAWTVRDHGLEAATSF